MSHFSFLVCSVRSLSLYNFLWFCHRCMVSVVSVVSIVSVDASAENSMGIRCVSIASNTVPRGTCCSRGGTIVWWWRTTCVHGPKSKPCPSARTAWSRCWWWGTTFWPRTRTGASIINCQGLLIVILSGTLLLLFFLSGTTFIILSGTAFIILSGTTFAIH
jgi:hypothetical protein